MLFLQPTRCPSGLRRSVKHLRPASGFTAKTFTAFKTRKWEPDLSGSWSSSITFGRRRRDTTYSPTHSGLRRKNIRCTQEPRTTWKGGQELVLIISLAATSTPCRFMDEQDIARDRSVSPNFHSLIYGDSKRRSETKLESIANGAEKSRGAGEGDDGTLAEATIL